MCINRKQSVNAALSIAASQKSEAAGFIWGIFALIMAFCATTASASLAGIVKAGASEKELIEVATQTASGLAPGKSSGGVIDQLFVVAPPGWQFTLETHAGSFVDCGDVSQTLQTDTAGRHTVAMSCGVTITETLVIPTASQSARVVIHH